MSTTSKENFKSVAKVVVMRKYNDPLVQVYMEDGELGVRMKWTDFVDALVEEVGSPALMFSKETLKSKLTNAQIAITTDLKKMSVYL